VTVLPSPRTGEAMTPGGHRSLGGRFEEDEGDSCDHSS